MLWQISVNCVSPEFVNYAVKYFFKFEGEKTCPLTGRDPLPRSRRTTRVTSATVLIITLFPRWRLRSGLFALLCDVGM